MQRLNSISCFMSFGQRAVSAIPSNFQYRHRLHYRGQTYRPSVPLRVYPSPQLGCYRGQQMTFNTPVRHVQDRATVNLCYRGRVYGAQTNLA